MPAPGAGAPTFVDNGAVSLTRQQAFIEAPLQTVWDLIADVERHPQWWPRVLEVQCEGLEQGCTYRQVVRTPFGREEMNLLVEGLEDCRNLAIRCISSGTFVRFALAEAQGGTFVDGQMGMDPTGIGNRVVDAVAGRRYFASWLAATFGALDEAARARADRTAA